jgi:RNA polymerase sigma-70 factor, ECF subfamily
MASHPHVPRPETDDELLRRTAFGDGEAFAELFERRHRDVYRFALHMTGSSSAADDVTQDVFLVAMRDASRYQEGRSTVSAWLCGIARNVARQRFDRERPLQPLAGDDSAGPSGPAIHPDPVGDIAHAARVERLRTAVLSLPVRYREAVVLCDLQELTYAEAADALGCAVGTVRSRLHRGRVLLAAKMTAHQTLVEARVTRRMPRTRYCV